jgi:hypothetical protein
MFAIDSSLSSLIIRCSLFAPLFGIGSLCTLVSLLCTLFGMAGKVITGTIGVGVFLAMGWYYVFRVLGASCGLLLSQDLDLGTLESAFC